jgi:hypothetical protein
MSKAREIRCFDYVNQDYERVRNVLKREALAICQAATKTAASRAASVASELRVNIGGIEVSTDIKIALREIEEHLAETASGRSTVVKLEWEAARMPRLFPFMHAELAVYPLTATETQLELRGHYEPPLGAFGAAVNALVGHRIADVSVHRFLAEVAGHLRASLTT